MNNESGSGISERLKNVFAEGELNIIKGLVLMFETEVSKDIHKDEFLHYVQDNPTMVGPSGEAIGHTLDKIRLLTEGEFTELVRPLHVSDKALDRVQE